MDETRSGREDQTAHPPPLVPDVFRSTDLPAEIQLQIFQLFMPHRTTAPIFEDRKTRAALLTLNRTIYDILAPPFYQYTTFHFYEPSSLNDFLANGSLICLRNFRNVTYHVEIPNDSLSKSFRVLSGVIVEFAKYMVDLETFRITQVGKGLIEQASKDLHILDGLHQNTVGSYWVWRSLFAHGDIIQTYAELDITLQGVFTDFTTVRKITRMMHGFNIDVLTLSYSKGK